MANLRTAYLKHDQVPARAALQEAIQSLRFKLTLDESYAPFECAGYIPCTLDGEDAGFEIKFAEIEFSTLAPELKSAIGECDSAIQIRSGADPREIVSAMIVAATLTKSFSALIHNQGEASFQDAEALFNAARSAFSALSEF